MPDTLIQYGGIELKCKKLGVRRTVGENMWVVEAVAVEDQFNYALPVIKRDDPECRNCGESTCMVNWDEVKIGL